MTRVQILAWNIQHGGGPDRTPEIALTIRAGMPDLVVLCEFRPTRGSMLRAAFADMGLDHHAVGAANHDLANRVFIASRWPLERCSYVPDPATARLLHVRTVGIDVIAAHIPDDSDLGARNDCWHRLLTLARSCLDRPAIILGDFNAGRRGQDGRAFHGEALLGTLTTLGFADAWRHSRPNQREDTWVGSWGAARLDTAFLAPPLIPRLVRCDYDHAPRLAGLSDHSAVMLDLDWSCDPHARNHPGLFNPPCLNDAERPSS
ncbi:MAG: hypothetical protein HBSAPP03_11970 [Phycisphaerae bacterium]|nr:MAG: hypothetical protein HBSAPP03_11970 [Phycisphaerae bacterium]